MADSTVTELHLNPSVVTTTLVSVLTVLTIYKLWRKQHVQCKYPPGPFSFPIIGNLPQVILSGSMNKFLRKYTEYYGDVFTVEFGGDKRVVVSGYDNIYNLLVKNADITSNRSVASFPPDFVEVAKETPGLVWAPFPHWKTIRTFSLNVLKDEGMGKQHMEHEIAEEVERFCDHYLNSNLSQSIDISSGLSKATCNIISDMIFGGRTEYDDPHFNKLMEHLTTSVKVIAKAGITKNIPLMKYFKASGIEDSDKASKIFLTEMEGRLTDHRAKLDPENPKDIFDLYLLHQQKVGTDSSGFTDGNASVMALQLYIAGTETTSTALRWALLYSCMKPGVIDRVQKEIDEQIGERQVCYQDRNIIPYTEAVLLETLRLANIGPTALPHSLDRELEMDGKILPSGADLMLHMASMLHDETVFEDPLEFKPERYLTGDIALKKQRTLAFSLGRRVCLGESLARMEFFMFYTTLLQKYNIRLADSDVNLSLEPVAGLINAPQPYKLIFIRRLL